MTPHRKLRQYKDDWFLSRAHCVAWAIVAMLAAVTTGPSVTWGCCIIVSFCWHVRAVGARRRWVFEDRVVLRNQGSLDNR